MILKRNVLSAALASAILMTATGVYAQPAGQSQDNGQATSQKAAQKSKKQQKKRPKVAKLGTVEVTGFASSVQNSIATQRNSDVIVEAVSAEQIGKLPGTSIADSLGRLPGLAVQTLAGRPQVLSIHGLGPDFSTALVNGRQQVSTGNNRGVQFDQYPSSWFNSVQVHLSPSAALLGQGLAGTVDMHTMRPLEKEHAIAAINANYVWDDLGQVAQGRGVGDNGYKVNGVWVDQFADHTFGVTVGVDFESNPTQIQHESPWGYPTTGGNYVIGGSKNYAISDQFKRTGLLTTLQYQPNENFTSTLDMTYDRFHDRQQAKGIEFPLAWSGAQLQPGYTVQNGLITTGTFTNVKPVLRNDYNRSLSKVYNIGWNNKWRINENWNFESDFSYSRADRHDAFIESYAGPSYGGSTGPFDTVNFNQSGPDGLWQLNNTMNYTPGNTYLTDPQGWGGGSGLVQGGFVNSPRVMDYIGDLRFSLERSFVSGPIASVKFGIDRANRKKTFNIDQRFLVPNNGSQTFLTNPWGAQTAPLPSGAITGDPLSFMGVGSQPLYDPIAAIKDGTYTQVPVFQSSLPLPPNWKVKETDTTPYVQFNLDTMLGNYPLRGNFGLQVAHTSQNATGERVAPTSSTVGSQIALIPVTGGTTYTRYLPSLNLVLGLNDAWDLRFGAARTMARARMDQINPSQGVSANITNLASTDPNNAYFSASGGNAKLLPSMAQNYNLSSEWYFGQSKGYFSVSGYFIKLTDYINPNSSYPYDFSNFVSSYLDPSQASQLGTTQGFVSGPTNSGHGYVRGAQVVLNTPLGLFTPVLKGFGVILSDNLTQSSIVYDGNPNPITVPGLSEHVINNTIYYERDGFQARVSQSYRSTFLGRIYGISASRQEQNIQGGSTYDAQVSYAIQSGSLKGLTFLLQGSNLTNKKFITYQGSDPRMIQTWENYGRRYELGVSYKFK